MSYLTIVAQVAAGEMEKTVLLDAMVGATKVYNGRMGELRPADQRTGKI